MGMLMRDFLSVGDSLSIIHSQLSFKNLIELYLALESRGKATSVSVLFGRVRG